MYTKVCPDKFSSFQARIPVIYCCLQACLGKNSKTGLKVSWLLVRDELQKHRVAGNWRAIRQAAASGLPAGCLGPLHHGVLCREGKQAQHS